VKCRMEGEEGNRKVPPVEFLGLAEVTPEEEGGTRGKHGFTRGSEPEAREAA
jgi:hypothetical protein